MSEETKKSFIPVKEVKDEFKKPKLVVGQYNHDALDDTAVACGIDPVAFEAKNSTMNDVVSQADESKNFVSQLAEDMESKFTTRELAFMCAQMSYVNMVEAFMQKGGNRAVKTPEGVGMPQQPQAPVKRSPIIKA